MKRDGRAGVGLLLSLPLLLFLAAVFVAPLVRLVPASLEETPGVLGRPLAANAAETAGGAAAGARAPSLANYTRALAADGALPIFRNSVLLSAGVAAVSLVVCLPAAWMLARHRFPGRALVRTVLALPLTFSGVIVGFLAILVLGRLGLLPALLELATGRRLLAGSAYTLGGLAAAYVYFEVPRAVLTLEAALARVDPALEQAAATLGAGPWTRFARIALPLTRGAMVSTLAVTFAASMGSFGVALILARRLSIVPLTIYTEYTGFLDSGYASALCLLLAALTLAANALLRKAARGKDWVYG